MQSVAQVDPKGKRYDISDRNILKTLTMRRFSRENQALLALLVKLAKLDFLVSASV